MHSLYQRYPCSSFQGRTMEHLAFVNKPGLVWNRICGPTQRSKCKPTRQPLMVTVASSPRTNLGQLHEEAEVQGPYCPLVDPVILRHCLLCAKQLQFKTERSRKKESVQKLLVGARQALGETQRGLAERFFLRALVVDPKNAKTYFLYALQVQRRDPKLARELFRQGSREDPRDAKLLLAWGLFESKQGKLARAQQLLKRSVELKPQNAPVLKWKVLFPQG